MNFEYEGKAYRINFRYERPGDEPWIMSGVYWTTALLDEAGDTYWIGRAKANARCAPGDNFERAVGRLIAFKRLEVECQTLGYTPAFIKELRRCFYTNCKLPRTVKPSRVETLYKKFLTELTPVGKQGVSQE